VGKENIKDLIEFREIKIEGVEDTRWMWPKVDKGASHGPVTDWNLSHRHKYFQNLKKPGVCITAGANMGLHVRHYAKLFDTVYAFEPHWLNFYCLSYNVPYTNVYKLQAALGATCGQVEISHDQPITNMGGLTVKPMPGSPRNTIPMLSIDSMNFPKVDFIQLDVEGYEAKVLEGAQAVLKRDKPVVVIERNRGEAIDILSKFNYQLQDKSISDYIYFVP
jgi:FkbM family methyltransferase